MVTHIWMVEVTYCAINYTKILVPVSLMGYKNHISPTTFQTLEIIYLLNKLSVSLLHNELHSYFWRTVILKDDCS